MTKRYDMEWKAITNHEQLESLIEESNNRPVLIFKHSTRCGVSRMVLRQFENSFDNEEEIAPYFLDLLQYRTLSDTIASHFNVVHQSPQLLLISKEKAIYNASHENIEAELLSNFI